MRRILDLLDAHTPEFTLGAALVLSVVLMSLGSETQAKVRAVVQVVLWPSQRAVSLAEGYASLWGENRSLRRELAERLLDEDRLRSLEAENLRLRDLLSFRARSDLDLIPAQLVGRDAGLLSGRVLVDRGRADGVGERMTVICPGGLVGKVGSVGEERAEVELLTAKGFAVSARVVNRDVHGVVKWDASERRLVMETVPVQVVVEPGEVVVSSDLGGTFVDGVRIGRVVETQEDESGLFNEVYLESPTYLWSLREIFIVRRVISSPADSILAGGRPAILERAR
jgi:rod shape-determining protein MreC